MSRLLTALLLVLFARPEALPGQAAAQAASIQPGARVRITHAGQNPRIAVVVARSADTLLVRWPEYTNAVAVPFAEISRLDVSTGRHRNVLKGAVVGTLSAGAVGAVLGAATYTPCESTEFLGCFLAPTSAAESAAVGGVVGGVLGLIVGSLVGLPARDDWRRVSLDEQRVAVAVTPRGRGTDLGVSLRF
jgi:hypothetical protein